MKNSEHGNVLPFPLQITPEQREAMARRAVDGVAQMQAASAEAGRSAGRLIVAMRSFGDAFRGAGEEESAQ